MKGQSPCQQKRRGVRVGGSRQRRPPRADGCIRGQLAARVHHYRYRMLPLSCSIAAANRYHRVASQPTIPERKHKTQHKTQTQVSVIMLMLMLQPPQQRQVTNMMMQSVTTRDDGHRGWRHENAVTTQEPTHEACLVLLFPFVCFTTKSLVAKQTKREHMTS